MRLLLSVIVVAVLGWSAYWYVGSSGVNSAIETWFDDRRAEGWVADYTDLSVSGYPNRIDTTITNLSLADPETGVAWNAPMFQLLALSYKPNHLIAVWPNEQTLSSPIQGATITSEDMRASLVVRPSTSLALDRTTFKARGLTVQSGESDDINSIGDLTLAAERVAVDDAPAYRLGLLADQVSLSLPLRRVLDPGDTLPETLDQITADLTVTFDKEWDLSAIETARPQPRHIDVELAKATWGQLQLELAGKVDVDAAGTPEGSITVKARNWRDILDLAINSGAVPEGLGNTIRDGLSLLSGLSGNPNTLDVPLDFRGGRVFLGPVPIGPAPVLKLR